MIISFNALRNGIQVILQQESFTMRPFYSNLGTSTILAAFLENYISHYNRQKIGSVNTKIRTRGFWVRSTNATSVHCCDHF